MLHSQYIEDVERTYRLFEYEFAEFSARLNEEVKSLEDRMKKTLEERMGSTSLDPSLRSSAAANPEETTFLDPSQHSSACANHEQSVPALPREDGGCLVSECSAVSAFRPSAKFCPRSSMDRISLPAFGRDNIDVDLPSWRTPAHAGGPVPVGLEGGSSPVREEQMDYIDTKNSPKNEQRNVDVCASETDDTNVLPVVSLETRSIESVVDPESQDEDTLSTSDSAGFRNGSNTCRAEAKVAIRIERSSIFSTSINAMISEGSMIEDGFWQAFRKLVRSTKFETFFSIIILLNCATMGMEAHGVVDPSAFNKDVLIGMEVSETVFSVLFTVEIALRLIVHGVKSFWPDTTEHRWNAMDAFLVIFTGSGFTLVIQPILGAAGMSDGTWGIRTLTVFRTIRLIRLMKVVQRVPVFREMWLLIRGLTDSLSTLFWTCVVIFFVTYIWAIFGLILIGVPLKDVLESAEHRANVDQVKEIRELLELLGGLDKLMFTLIQVLTLDSFHGFMRTLVRYFTFSWLYFYSYIAVAVFVLMNLVTAIIVDNAMMQSKDDEFYLRQKKDAQRQKDLKELKRLFMMTDTDSSGTICWNEFEESFRDTTVANKWALLDFQPEDCHELFRLLDDGDGEIETGEFFDGLARMKGIALSKDIFRVQKGLDNLNKKLGETHVTKSLSVESPRRMSACTDISEVALRK
eukprot:TRINITY_DN8165_c0_g1_i13.p1 TRINITY_DN8165_c0_g1~~TRINITY_DN8165_c0_g1_i13.p1  ORF type:complete len:689 (+),score=113.36 TRINITY_DN8165_c0_g1_i13:58-2124(+)